MSCLLLFQRFKLNFLTNGELLYLNCVDAAKKKIDNSLWLQKKQTCIHNAHTRTHTQLNVL